MQDQRAADQLGNPLARSATAGAGDSYSHDDPDHRLSFGYAMNLMHMGAWLVDPRARRLLGAAFASL